MEKALRSLNFTALGFNAVSFTYCYRCDFLTVHPTRTDLLKTHQECAKCKTRYPANYLRHEPDPRALVREIVARHLECVDKLNRGKELMRGDPAEAQRFAKEAEAICVELGNNAVLSDAMELLAYAKANEGRPDQAEALFLRQEELASEVQDGARIVRSLNGRADVIPRSVEEKLALLGRAEHICRVSLSAQPLDHLNIALQQTLSARMQLLLLQPNRLPEARLAAEERLHLLEDLAQRRGQPQLVGGAKDILLMIDALIQQSSGPSDVHERVPPTLDLPIPHPAANPERAAQLNIQFKQDLASWNALSWWKRLRLKKPQRPAGI